MFHTFSFRVEELRQQIECLPKPVMVDARALHAAGVGLRGHLLEHAAPAARQRAGERTRQQPRVQRRQVLVQELQQRSNGLVPTYGFKSGSHSGR